MNNLLYCYKAEFNKQKHTVFYPLHIGIPVLYVFTIAFLLWRRQDTLTMQYTVTLFYQIILLAFPLISAVLCGMVADREGSAGNYQVILTQSPNKCTALFSQLLMLATMCALSLLTAIAGLMGLMVIWNVPFQAGMVLKAGLVLLLSVFPLYTIHLLFAYKAGIGMCSILGFAGVIISALAETGMLDMLWIAVPYCWPFRFVHSVLYTYTIPYRIYYYIPALLAISLLLYAAFWFRHWEGRQRVE